jgi:hypothetical protein
MQHKCTMHIEIDMHFIRDKIAVEVMHVFSCVDHVARGWGILHW